MKIIDEVKMLILGSNITLTKLAKEVGEKIGKDYKIDNFSSKLRRETIHYKEIKIIADLLGYEIKFVKKQ